MKHQEKYIKLILEVLSEAERLVMLKEAVPYNVVKKYLQIERDPTAENRLTTIFEKLKALPNAVQLDKRGDRIALPYNIEKKSESSIEKEISTYIKKYNFNIKDYTKGVAYDEKNKRDVKLGKVINLAIKKETNPSIQKKIQDIFNKFNTDPKRAQASKDSNYSVVFTKHKYDIAGMTAGRDWKDSSCMNILKGSMRRFVDIDIKEGTFIAYVIDSKDTNIENPVGRVLIKPYIKIDAEEEVGDVVTDGDNVINYAESKSYGSIPGGFDRFLNFVDDIMGKVQKTSGYYKRLGCLYQDSKERANVRDKETVTKVISYKIKNGKLLDEKEFEVATEEQKKKHIDSKVKQGSVLDEKEFEAATDKQKQESIDNKLLARVPLDRKEFEIAVDVQKKKHIDIQLENKYFLNKDEFEAATDEQKKKHIDIQLENQNPLNKYEFEAATDEQKKEYVKRKLEKDISLNYYELEAATDEQKKKHIYLKLENKAYLNKYEFEVATEEQKKKHIDLRLENRYLLEDYEFEAATDKQKQESIDNRLLERVPLDRKEFKIAKDEQKKKHIDIIIKMGRNLEAYELEAATDKQKKEYIDKRIENEYSLKDYELEIATDEQKKEYIDKRIEMGKDLETYELKAATDEQKKEYVDKRIENKYSINKDEIEAATDEQKKKFIKRTLDRGAYSGILDSTDLISMLTPKQEIKIGNLVAGEIDDIDNKDLIELTIETLKNVFEILPKRASSILIKALKEKEQYLNDDVKKYLKSLTIK